MDVGAWLRGLGLQQYERAFSENDVDADVLPELTEADLERLGVASLGHRKRLLRGIAALSHGSAASTPVARPPSGPHGEEPGPAETRQAERRQLTVMFVDLVGSTALSSRLDPEEMGEVLRGYQNAVVGEITRFGGYAAKYLGDGILAYFSWPEAHEDDAERAVRAGLDLVEAVGRLGAPGGGPLAARVGIATGIVVVGELIGAAEARERAVVGETPNLAARLQQLAEPGTVVLSEPTRRLIGGLFELEELPPLALKGLEGPQRAYRVLGEGPAEDRRFEALRGAGLLPLVGREHELALLLGRWERARDGEGQVVLLAGEPGIGKSRLLRALRERLGHEPLLPLSLYCSPFRQASPLHPVIDHLERAARFDRGDPPSRKLDKLEALLAQGTADVVGAAPLLAALLSIPAEGRYPPLALDPERQKERTLEVLLGQLAGLAAHRPVLELFEDVHWADPTTLEFLDLLVERVRTLPVLVVVTFRHEFAPRWTGHPHVTLLSLGRLGRRQGAAIVERLTGGMTLPAEVLRQIVDRTDGVPLFVEELTKAVLESGLLREEEGGYALAGRLSPLAIPSTLHDSLMARLDRLAPVKEVAQVGAAIGREFSRELLAAVAPLPEGELDEALERLTEAELVFRRGLPPEATYVFKHALVQEAAYQSLLKSRRVDLHGRIARALERHMPDAGEAQPELLAHHYSEAGLAREAITYWLKAGERAARRSAHPEAVAHLRRGLGLVERLTGAGERASRELDLQVELGISLLATKGFAAPEVGETYRRAERLATEAGQHAKLYAILQGQFHHHAVRGEIGRCLRLAERCHAMARAEGDPVLLLGAHYTLCAGVCWRGEFAAAKAHLEEVLRLEEVAGRRPLRSLIGIDLRVFARAFGCHALWHFGLVDQAAALSDEAVALARSGADPFSLVIALSYGAMLRQFGRDRGAAERLTEEAIGVCAERHFAYYLAWATIIRGWARATAGSVDEGLVGLRQGLAAIEATGSRLRRPYYLSLLADALAQAGRVEEALEALEEALATSEAAGERWRDADLHRLRGRVLLTLPDRRAGDAEACFTTALDLARRQDALALELQAALALARLWADRGRRREAHELLAPIHSRFTEGFDTPDLTEAATLLEALG